MVNEWHGRTIETDILSFIRKPSKLMMSKAMEKLCSLHELAIHDVGKTSH